jgi:poly(glycerol-phosphate) alpha-glucosyltransferase
MDEPELPPGRYLTVAYQVHPQAGGQTRAMLMRTRILAQQGGVRPEVLALGPVPDSAERRTALLEQGALIEEIATRNLYDHYREHGWGDEPPGEPLPDLSAHTLEEQPRADGSVLRVVYRPAGGRRVYDYPRADGTPFLRVVAHAFSRKSSWPSEILRVGPDGRVCGAFGSLRAWHHRWLRELTAGDERVFVFTDSRYVLPHLAPLRDRRMRLLYQMHNLHLSPPARSWDGPMERAYKRVLKRASDVDAFVTLTARQRDEIAARRGRTSNMHVVANPVTIPPAPDPPPARDPLRATVLARLSPQKQLVHAVTAWERVVAAVPGARLDIYGEGPERELVESAIAERGLGEAIAMRGFDPGARDALWTSSALLLTSVFEGYPLSTLEAMARGCPVVAYDIRYGPREQITDGVDGFVVPDGDVAALAARVVELLRSPERVLRMSGAARTTARRHDVEGFLRHWAEVIAAADADAPRRPRVKAVRLELGTLEESGTGRLARLAGRTPVLAVAGRVAVEQRGKPRGLRDARLELAWVDPATGAVREVPVEVARGGGALRFTATAPLPEAPAALRLRLLWRAFAWQRELRPAG